MAAGWATVGAGGVTVFTGKAGGGDAGAGVAGAATLGLGVGTSRAAGFGTVSGFGGAAGIRLNVAGGALGFCTGSAKLGELGSGCRLG